MNTISYCSNISALDDPDVFRNAYGTVSSYRRKRIDSMASLEDKKRSMGAEILLRMALGDIGIKLREIRCEIYGKPFLIDSDVHFSLSHSGNRVMCSISDGDVGCDVERIRPMDLRIARRFFSNKEYMTISSAKEQDNDMFLRLWTLKESFLKTTGMGMRLPLDSFTILIGKEVAVEQNVDDREYHFREFDMGDGYHYACCSITPISDRIREVTLTP